MDEDHYDTPWEFLVRPGSIRLSTAQDQDRSRACVFPVPLLLVAVTPRRAPHHLFLHKHLHRGSQMEIPLQTLKIITSTSSHNNSFLQNTSETKGGQMRRGLDRIEAEKRLESTNLGDYLLRYRKEGSAALSLKGSTSVLHIKLERRDGQWIVGEGPTFRSISSAIQYYRRHPLPIRGAEHVLLNRNFSKTGYSDF
ncbi:unnamed protein product, partial [Mesorhabditis belari]|uniref:SH2 domain-containing protein n=1 Tax=Mesorhabditis belari TaxID=2138241 RepID=A0AAF3F6Q5_9BILA